MSNTPSDPNDEARFLSLVAMFQMAAMQQMGKLANPISNEIERDLQQAKATIDVLEMLNRKTEGNRGSREDELLEKVLFELRMNYVDETNRPESDSPSDSPDDGPDVDPATENGDDQSDSPA
jgi:hypothetical protein